jgi:hypothetical protein
MPMDCLVLNDEALYGNLGDDWSRVFFRLPSLPAELLVGEDEVFPNCNMHAGTHVHPSAKGQSGGLVGKTGNLSSC